jgi:UDP-glucose 4-epimerase
MKKVFVTGAAGFIGSNLVDRLLRDGNEVVGYDNLSTGLFEFLGPAFEQRSFQFVKGDLLDQAALTKAMAGCDLVCHLAANADVRFGTNHPRKDLEQNTIATANVLEAMRANGARRIAFSSTGSVYGEAKIIPTPEDGPMPIQTSFYGASKLAGEGLIESYCEGFGFQGFIFRFVSVLGERYTHGHVYDFYKQFNLGADEYCEVNDSIGWIAERLGLTPRLSYGGGDRGWIGDNPFIFLDTRKIRALGWQPRLSIRESIVKTVEYLQSNRWLYGRRSA